jgi:hypothetical protein
MTEAGAKRALKLNVGGAFHSPLMEPAREELAAAIENTHFNEPSCPVYQNVTGTAITDVAEIKKKLGSSIDGSRSLDTNYEEYDCRRLFFIYRSWPRQSFTRLVEKN